MEYMVSVRCFTYNHSKYITDALNGFVSQQTTFPFVIVVVDDASTDGEQDVIRSFVNEHFDVDNVNAENRETEYAHITCASHKSNKNCDIVVLYLKYNHYQLKKKKLPYLSEWLDNSKYHALCEGDDYWIDPLKLQKQVDFLEANPEYGMCYTNFNIYRQDSGKMEYDVFTSRSKEFPIRYNTPEEFVLSKGYVCPPSWVFRKECLPSEDQNIKSLDGTFVMFSHFLCTTKVYGLVDTTAVYRALSESASHSKNYNKIYERTVNLLETQYKLIDYYGLNPDIKKQCEINFYKENLVQFVLHNRKDDIKQAKKVLAGYCGRREKILFVLSSIYGGRQLLRCVYDIYKSR